VRSLTRAELFRAGTRTGAGITGLSLLGLVQATASAAAPTASLGAPPAGDLAYARLLICFELLELDFHANAIRSKHLTGRALRELHAALANEEAHYAYLAGVITNAGGTPLSAADVDFSYPARAFYTAASVKRLALELETLTLGSYLGAAGSVATPGLQAGLAQITANEAQHVSAFALANRRPPFADAFPGPLTIEEASNALGAYTS
jgi:hypothetical protein